ncbi:MAG TPA: bile acid:sodium symporter, partial [Edaphocola sp.]|nr:bile acid:sodium symporter [Edaphocola sp.]
PSTVSSSVVMVSIAKGNIPGAIFNASISSLLGIFITPLWMGWVIATGTIELGSFSGILVKLLLQVFVPVVLGLLLNRFWGHWAYKNARFLKLFDQSIILLVVYLSFAESFVLGLFDNSSWLDLFWVFAGSLLLFGIAYIIIGFLSKKMKFSREDTITATFAGSKKSLVHGTVMAGIIFADFAGVGIILLPIMVYHALQLVLVSWIAQRKVKVLSSYVKKPPKLRK